MTVSQVYPYPVAKGILCTMSSMPDIVLSLSSCRAQKYTIDNIRIHRVRSKGKIDAR